jgi:electron transport complex protein RnfG
MASKILSNKIYPLVFLTIIVLASVSLLVYINSITAPIVEAQQEAEIKNMLSGMFADMDDYKYEDEIYTIYQDSEIIGYAFLAKGKGYGGEINILVGVNEDFTIEDVVIISNTETPGLGSKITESSFTDQFKGMAAGDVALKKDGGEVDAITGATISSKAVVEAIRKAMEEKINLLEGD